MNPRQWIGAWSRSLGQIALSDRASDGALILVAIAVIAPFSAVGAAVGALVGVLATAKPGDRSGGEWEQGIWGVNPAIVGIMWGGPLSRGGGDAWLFGLALVATILADRPLRGRLLGAGLPPLASTAVLVGWCSHWVYHSFGVPFWPQVGLEPLGPGSLYVSVALIAVVLVRTSIACCVAALALGSIAAIVSGYLLDLPLGPPDLWGFAVVPAAVVPFVLLRPKPSAALVSGIGGAVASTVLWTVWTRLPGIGAVPPLLAPSIVGVWIALAVVTRGGGARVTDPVVWRAVEAMKTARESGKTTVVLTGAGVSTASGIPDYISGAWFDPRIPASNYGFAVYKASRKCRIAYWEACNRFRSIATRAVFGPPHRALAAMEESGFVSAVVTQNVDGLHQKAGSRNVIELHGNIFDQRCLKCHRAEPWSDGTDWRDDDVHCARCGGLVKPAVIAFGEDIHPKTWRQAMEAVSGCGILLVTGTQLAVSSAIHLLGTARRQGATIVFVNDMPAAHAMTPDDITIWGRSENILPAISWLLSDGVDLTGFGRHLIDRTRGDHETEDASAPTGPVADANGRTGSAAPVA